MRSNTLTDTSLLMARLVVALVVAAHGVQKLLGWFGGFGFDGTMNFFMNTIGVPYIAALLIIIVESLGMIALAVGLGSRLFAAFVMLIMIGAIATVHGQFGFFMNWNGNSSGEGFEFHLILLALSAITFLNGGGRYSVDAYLRSRFSAGNRAAFLYR